MEAAEVEEARGLRPRAVREVPAEGDAPGPLPSRAEAAGDAQGEGQAPREGDRVDHQHASQGRGAQPRREAGSPRRRRGGRQLPLTVRPQPGSAILIGPSLVIATLTLQPTPARRTSIAADATLLA